MSNEQPFDICECGDYRHQHVDGIGRCRLGSLCAPSQCQKFRLFRCESPTSLIAKGEGK
jgi:hypothetical protein